MNTQIVVKEASNFDVDEVLNMINDAIEQNYLDTENISFEGDQENAVPSQTDLKSGFLNHVLPAKRGNDKMELTIEDDQDKEKNNGTFVDATYHIEKNPLYQKYKEKEAELNHIMETEDFEFNNKIIFKNEVKKNDNLYTYFDILEETFPDGYDLREIIKHFDGNIVTIRNTVSYFNTESTFDRDDLLMYFKHIKFNEFKAPTVPNTNPKSTFLVYTCGVIICLQTSSIATNKLSCVLMARNLKQKFQNVKLEKYKMVNIISTFYLPWSLELDLFCKTYDSFCEKRENFPGIYFHLPQDCKRPILEQTSTKNKTKKKKEKKPKVILFVQNSNNFVGCESSEQVYYYFLHFYDMVKNFFLNIQTPYMMEELNQK